jgi:hypothetical protein
MKHHLPPDRHGDHATAIKVLVGGVMPSVYLICLQFGSEPQLRRSALALAVNVHGDETQ